MSTRYALLVGLVAAVLSACGPASPVAPTLLSVDVEIARPVQVGISTPQTRTVDVYRGQGAWLDGFDYSPPYGPGGLPVITAETAIAEMAAAQIDTLYVQTGRLDDRSPDVLEDRWVLAELLLRSHQAGIGVVGWYLPKWGDDGADLAHLVAIDEFEVLGHRFDGIGVDIEWNEDGLDPDERSRRLVSLSQQLADAVGADPLAAIVLPPVQTEVLNTSYWPGFPWSAISGLYDVWMPMSYWSFRTGDYGDGAAYNLESTARLRANLGDADALVHAIGGVGAQLDAPPPGTEPYIGRPQELSRFLDSLVASEAIGGSIYDWLTTDAASRQAATAWFSANEDKLGG